MKDSDLQELTSNFPEIKTLIESEKTLKLNIQRIRRRLKTHRRKFKFYDFLAGINRSGDDMDVGLKMLLNSLDLKDVHNVSKKQQEDVRLRHHNSIFLFETHGTKNINPKNEKAGEIINYLNTNKIHNNDKDVFGIFLVNHHNNVELKHRNPEPFTKDQIKYSIAGNYGLLSSPELLKGYGMVRRKEITINDFLNKLKTFGEIRF